MAITNTYIIRMLISACVILNCATAATSSSDLKPKELIRDVSPQQTIKYIPDSLYDLVPPFYKDKISVRETAFNTPDFFFKTLGSIVPRRWQLNVKEINIHHLDAFDALTIGIHAGNVSIVKAALDLLPLTKSILVSGKTTDFMDHTPVFNNTFAIDQFIELTYDNMACTISQFRLTKTIAGVYLALMIENNTIQRFASIAAMEQFFGESLKNPVTVNTVKYAVPAITLAITHYLEHDFVDGYIQIFTLLINHPLATFDHAKTKQCLEELKSQLQWFGTKRTASNRLQALIDTLSCNIRL